MKIGRRRVQLLLFLLASVIVSEATEASLPRESLAKNFANARSLGEVVAASGGNVGGGKPSPVGTEHAPVDGKDGMPHEGPFVETNAERTRKKTQGMGYDDDLTTEKTTHNVGNVPQSNDAVMDDRLNSNPAEGTRGVEGGISEKSKEGKSTDKRPDPPKDARPLPHHEVETLKDTDKMEEEPKKVLTVSQTTP
jgi:hypothetical protein